MCIRDSSTTIQPHDHGTHVAGTISAVNHNGIGVSGIAGGSGLGDGVRLMSCQVFGPYDNGGFELAPVWAADNGAVISQNSWGYTSAGYYEQAVLDAIDYFNQNAGSETGSPMDGGITIFAAGNSNSTGPVSYTHLRAHETVLDLVCRLLLEKKKKITYKNDRY